MLLFLPRLALLTGRKAIDERRNLAVGLLKFGD